MDIIKIETKHDFDLGPNKEVAPFNSKDPYHMYPCNNYVHVKM